MVLLGRMDLQEKLVNLDLPDHLDLLAEGDQELQGYLEPTGCRAESDPKVQQVLRVFQDFLDLLAPMAPQVFLELSMILMVTFCVLQSAHLVPPGPLGCRDSRVTQDIKEIRESLEKMEKKVILVHLAHLVFPALWVCRAHVV